ncbi:MAG: AAA family ATPase [Chloroflexi bacterium]|nr:AAA family ATPase [Chloroflexota bacterium]
MGDAIRIMIVDDSSENRGWLRRQFAGTSFAVVGEVSLGPEAVAQCRESRADAVVIGVEDPIARALRTIEILAVGVGIPILAVSSLNDREALRRVMLAGARDFVVKPLAAEDLRQALVDVLELDRRRMSLASEVAESGHHGEIIVVFGAKGGVGKTTLATNLAVALARDAKQRVVLVDLDTHLGDVGLLLDLPPDRSIADVVPLIDKLDPELLRSFVSSHESGVHVLAAPARPEVGETVGPKHVQKLLDVLTRTYDAIVVDTPRAFNDNTITAMDAANLILLLTTLEVPSVKNTRLCLDTLRSWHYPTEKVKLLINHAHSANGVGNHDVELALEYPIFWKIPYDPAVCVASRRGRPFVQDQAGARVARNVSDLAAVLSGSKPPSRSLLARVLG